MARVVFDGNYQVLLVPDGDITDKDAPTVGELTDSYVIDITSLCPKDFLDFGGSQGRVNAGDIRTRFSAQLMGTWLMDVTFTCFLDSDPAENLAWLNLDDGQRWDVVILWAATADSPEDGDQCYVMPLEFGKHMPTNPAENEQQRFTVEAAAYAEPHLEAIVVGS